MKALHGTYRRANLYGFHGWGVHYQLLPIGNIRQWMLLHYSFSAVKPATWIELGAPLDLSPLAAAQQAFRMGILRQEFGRRFF